jgi:hypothetical protein
MENRMKVKGILVEGDDGQTYLLGMGPRSGGAQPTRPTIWRVSASQYEPLEETRTASTTIRENLGLQSQLTAGQNHDSHVKHATIEAVTEFIKTFFHSVRW